MNGLTREEHLQVCKQRALEYLDAGQLDQALASMGSDLAKHNGTRNLAGQSFMLLGMHAAMTNDHDAMRRWINGFN